MKTAQKKRVADAAGKALNGLFAVALIVGLMPSMALAAPAARTSALDSTSASVTAATSLEAGSTYIFTDDSNYYAMTDAVGDSWYAFLNAAYSSVSGDTLTVSSDGVTISDVAWTYNANGELASASGKKLEIGDFDLNATETYTSDALHDWTFEDNSLYSEGTSDPYYVRFSSSDSCFESTANASSGMGVIHAWKVDVSSEGGSTDPEPTTYKVTFDSDGGTDVAAQDVAENGTATAPDPAPTRDGYTFKGWFLGDATDAYDFSTPVTGAITLKAKWQAEGAGSAPAVNSALAEGSSLAISTTTPDAWTAKTVDGRTFAEAAGAANASIEVTAPANSWLIFDWVYTDTKYVSDWQVKTTVSVDGTVKNTLGSNSSTNHSWATLALQLNEGKQVIDFTAVDPSAKGATVALDNVRMVTGTTAVSAQNDGHTTSAVQVSSSDVTEVNPGTEVTFTAVAAEGYVFAGWKTSLDDEDFVSVSSPYKVKVWDTPVTLFACADKAFEGIGTEAEPFQISSMDDLKKLVTYAGSGNTFAGQYFKVMNDINATGSDFTGITGNFGGTFDGNNCTISGLSDLSVGLFKQIAAGATVKDLTVDGIVNAAAQYAGRLAARNDGSISNVTVKGSVASSKQSVGGITGYSKGPITDCTVEATVTSSFAAFTNSYVGGVAGESGLGASFTNCTVTGKVSGGTVAAAVGGILGYSGSSGTIDSCSVKADVEGKAYMGGIVGYEKSSMAVKSSSYEGNVTATGNYAGGIIGYMSANNASLSIDGNTAAGTVTAGDWAGGIVGYTTQAGTIQNSTAKQTSIKTTGTHAGRIAGENVNASWGGASTLSDNQAAKDMLVNDAVVADDQKGADTIQGADAAEKQERVITTDKDVYEAPVTDNYGFIIIKVDGVEITNDNYDSADYGITCTSSDSNIAPVKGWGRFTPWGLGTCTITISLPETDTYKAAEKTVTVNIVKGKQNLTLAEYTITKRVNDESFSLGANSDRSADFAYESDNENVATVDTEGNVTIVGAGECKLTVTATPKGNDEGKYEVASTFATLTVSKLEQTVTLASELENKFVDDASFNVGAASSLEGATFTYESSNTDVATVDAEGNVTIVGLGTTTIKATASGNDTYDARSNTMTLNVTKHTQTIETAVETINAKVGDDAVNLGAQADTALTYESSDENVATVDENGKVTPKAAGTATITISAEATDTYEAASKNIEVTVTEADQPGAGGDQQGTGGDQQQGTGADQQGSGSNQQQGTAADQQGNGSAEQVAAAELISNKITSGTKLSKLKSAKKSLKVTWKKAKKSKANGYQIRYSTSKKMKNAKKVKVKTYKATSKTIKKLKSGKKYYVQIRTYKKVNGKTYYSTWSKVKKAKVK